MPVPSSRTPVRVARGTYANLSTVDALAALNEGEICFATDQQKLYVKQGAGLTSITSSVDLTTYDTSAEVDTKISNAALSLSTLPTLP